MSEVEEVIEMEKKLKEEKEKRLEEVRSKKESAQGKNTRSDLMTLLIRFKLWWTGIISGTVREMDLSTNSDNIGKIVVDTPLGEAEVCVRHPDKYSSKNDLARQLALKGKEETEYSELYGEKVQITGTCHLKDETKWVLYQPYELDVFRKSTFLFDKLKRYVAGIPINCCTDEWEVTKRPSLWNSLSWTGLGMFLFFFVIVVGNPVFIFGVPIARVLNGVLRSGFESYVEYAEKDTLVDS